MRLDEVQGVRSVVGKLFSWYDVDTDILMSSLGTSERRIRIPLLEEVLYAHSSA